jgi:hypothetical protein
LHKDTPQLLLRESERLIVDGHIALQLEERAGDDGLSQAVAEMLSFAESVGELVAASTFS